MRALALHMPASYHTAKRLYRLDFYSRLSIGQENCQLGGERYCQMPATLHTPLKDSKGRKKWHISLLSSLKKCITQPIGRIYEFPRIGRNLK
jgi:hypothetical protein